MSRVTQQQRYVLQRKVDEKSNEAIRIAQDALTKQAEAFNETLHARREWTAAVEKMNLAVKKIHDLQGKYKTQAPEGVGVEVSFDRSRYTSHSGNPVAHLTCRTYSRFDDIRENAQDFRDRIDLVGAGDDLLAMLEEIKNYKF